MRSSLVNVNIENKNKKVDINRIVSSNKLPFGKQDLKYFIGYKNNKKIRPLYIFFPKMSTYRSFDKKKLYVFHDKKKFLISIMKFEKKLAIL